MAGKIARILTGALCAPIWLVSLTVPAPKHDDTTGDTK